MRPRTLRRLMRHRSVVLARCIRQYSVCVALACGLLFGGVGCAADKPLPTSESEASAAVSGPSTTLVDDFRNTDLGNGWKPTGHKELQYARCFTIDSYEGGYQLACLADGNRYLIVPEGAEVPSGISDDIIVLQQPIRDVYLVASDSMCLFDALDALDRITVSGLERDRWQVAAAREAMDAGSIVYGGNYRTPDYELLLSQGVRLALENTMINHVPDVREKLIELGIPVLVELSSYESEPLGRAEWVRFYGTLLDEDARAEEVFQAQVDEVRAISPEPTGKTVAYFYLNNNGAAVVRRPGDYVTAMIEQAGGETVFQELGEATTASGSVTLQMEQFYTMAKDADVIIYNTSIDGSVQSLEALVEKTELLSEFKAVQTGEVWATDQNMYQQMIETGGIIADINRALRGSRDADLVYLRRLS